ncbi:hypothetical protein EIP86_010837 [Pleurotus ostreatoroseus]|nr:hypothetical protein EIP86_010837 [Pleurotus ostreatoroseus]
MPALYHIGETSTHDVVIFPIIQGGQFGIREEERALAMLFDEIDRNANQSVPAMDITSGYFGIYKDYCSLMLQSRMGCRILAASPKVKEFDLFYIALLKGFYRPTVFTDLEVYLVVYLKDIPFSSNALCVHLQEWEKDGWTYHAKENSDPYLTLFGSTNLNSRSANLDTELSFILATTSSKLRRRLAHEVEDLWSHAQAWRGMERRVRLGTKAIVAAVGGML